MKVGSKRYDDAFERAVVLSEETGGVVIVRHGSPPRPRFHYVNVWGSDAGAVTYCGWTPSRWWVLDRRTHATPGRVCPTCAAARGRTREEINQVIEDMS